MKALRRTLEGPLREAARSFSAVVLTGPRRAGKTHCLRHVFPKAKWLLLEDTDVLARVKADPRGWLERQGVPDAPVILDEIQNAPELLPYVRTMLDRHPRAVGRVFLTGSQDFALMEGVSESMAGRAAILHMLPLSVAETGSWSLLRGGYPEVWQRPRAATTWFRSYVETYLERDVRAVTAVKDLTTFRRFMALLAARNGNILNRNDLAGPLGVSVPTISAWLDVLQITGIVLLVPPYFENLDKRIVKSPKVLFTDTGLLCHLLGFESERALEGSPFLGGVFEAFVGSEIVKAQINAGRERALYHFRDQQGLEVDFLVPEPDGNLALIEAKWSRTVRPEMARGIAALLPRVRNPKARGLVVHRSAPGVHHPERGSLVPGASAINVEALVAEMTARP